MATFDNNGDQNDNRDNNIEKQEQTTKAPEYSFWAEQMPGGTYSSYNPKTNSYEFNNNAAAIEQDSKKGTKSSKPGNKAIKFIAKAIFFGLIAGISFIGLQKIYFNINPDAAKFSLNSSEGLNLDSSGYKLQTTQPGVVQVKLRSAISDVVDTTMPSIVSINSVSTGTNAWFGQQYDQESSGSGIIVGKNEDELLIATNNHVVAGTNQITVTFINGKTAEAVIKGTDATADLAVISVDISGMEEDTLKAIGIAKLGSSDQIKVGEMAIAIGNALGYGQSVTVGYISAKDREVDVSDGYSSKTMVLLQTDAAINPGNSGGALLNVNGEVVGINTVKYSSNEVEGMGYAIPISLATPIINELMNREILKAEEQGFLGITGNDVTEDVASSFNIPVGVSIFEVVEGGSAAKAGLLSGDVITAVNDVEITAITQLREYVNSLRVGTEVKITYMRSVDGTYKENVVTVALGANPNLKATEN